MVKRLDALDHRILREVQKDCLIGASDLADRCGTSESTALRRLKSLRESGVIKSEVAIIDGAKVGRGMLVQLSVRLEGEDSQAAKTFVDRLSACPEVLQFYFLAGNWDYSLLVSVKDMEDFDRFVAENLVGHPSVSASESSFVIRPIKMSLALPI